MNDVMNNWTAQLIGMILIGAAAVAAFWVSEGLESAAVTAAVCTRSAPVGRLLPALLPSPSAQPRPGQSSAARQGRPQAAAKRCA